MRRKRPAILASSVATLFTLCLLPLSVCAQDVWDGDGANDNWLTGANWLSNSAPSAGANLQFAGTVQTTSNNNFAAGTSFNSLSFDAGVAAYTLTGNAITLVAGITNNATGSTQAQNFQVIDFGGTGITLGSSQTWNANGSPMIVESNVALAGHTLTIIGQGSIPGVMGDVSTAITGNISGAGGITVNTMITPVDLWGAVRLLGSNSYTGATLVQSGVLDLGTALCGSGAVVQNGATLAMEDGLDAGSVPVSINGSGLTGGFFGTASGAGAGALFGGADYSGGSSQYGGVITLTGNATIGVQDGGGFTLTGGIKTQGHQLTLGTEIFGQQNESSITVNTAPISGTGSVVVDSQWVYFDVANTYTGTTNIVNGAFLWADVPGALPAPPADGGAGTARSAVLMDQTDTGSSTLYLNANQAIASLTGASSSTVDLDSSTLTIGTTNPSTITEFYGTISDDGNNDGSLIKDGTSTQILSGGNTYGGTTTINGGTLQIGDGVTPGASITSGTALFGLPPVQVNATGTLAIDLVDGETFPNAVALNASNASLNAIQSGTITISGVISGSGVLNQNGSGTTILNNAETYTGRTTVNAGTLQIGDGVTAGAGIASSGTVQVNGTGTLAIDLVDGETFPNAVSLNAASTSLNAIQSGSITLPGVISGTGSLNMIGTGTLTLSAENTYTGGTNINGGTLVISADSNLGGSSGTLTFNGGNLETTADVTSTRPITLNAGGGTFSPDSGKTLTVGGVISGGGALTVSGAGTLTLTGSNTYTGSTTVATGTLAVAGGGTLGSGGLNGVSITAVTLNSNTTLDISQADASVTIGSLTGSGNVILGSNNLTVGSNPYFVSTTFAGVIQGDGSLTKIGPSKLQLLAANTFTGDTNVNFGQLEVDNTFASGTVTVNQGTLTGYGTITNEIDLNFGGVVAPLGKLTAGSMVWNSGGYIQEGVNVPNGGLLSLNGEFTQGSGSSYAFFLKTGPQGVQLNTPYTLVDFDGAKFPSASVFSEAGIDLPYVFTLNPQSLSVTFTEPTSDSDGGTGDGSGSAGISNGQVLQNSSIGGPGVPVLDTFLVISAVSTGGPTDNNTIYSLIFSSGSSLSVNNTLSVTSGYFTVPAGGALVTGGNLSVPGDLNKNGSGTLVVGSNMTVGGNVYVNNGAFIVNGNLASASTVTVNSSGTLGGSGTISGAVNVNSGGTITGGGLGTIGTLSLGSLTMSASSTYSVDIGSGANNADKLAITGTVTLNGANISFNQLSTPDQASYVLLTTTGALTGTFTGTAPTGYTLTYLSNEVELLETSVPTTLTWNGGSGTWNNTTANWNSSAAKWQAGDTAIFNSPAGTVTLGAPISAAGLTFNTTGYTIAGSNALTLTGLAPTITVTTAGNTATISAQVSGSAGLTVSGAGTLILTNSANNYTGATTVSSGQFQIGNGASGNLDAAGAVTVNAGATLAVDLVTSGTFANNVNDNGTVNAIATGTNTLSGVVSGSGVLNQNGTGTTILTGENTYTGTTTIAAGTLQIGNGGTTGSLGSGAVTDNTVLAFNYGTSNTLTVANTITGTGGVNQNGPGTSILTGIDTYTGVTKVTAGTLQVGNGTSGNLTGTSGVTVSAGTTLATDLANSQTFTPNITLNGTGAFNAIQPVNITNTIQGPITGTGAVNQSGTGTTILTGENTYTGTTTITAGTLQIGNGGTTGSLGSGKVVDNSILTFELTSSPTVANTITGTGAVNQSGTGTTTLTGINTYTGATTVSAGTLAVNGSLAPGSIVTAQSGGTLGGSGTISSAVNVNSGGTITGGGLGTIGTLSLGSLTMSASSTYSVDIGSGANNADKLAITGTVTLNGANISFNQLSTPDQASYVLLTTAGALTGTFTGTAPTGYTLTYLSNEVELLETSIPTTLTWNGGSGTWNNTTANWNSSAAKWQAGDTAIFNSSAGTVTLGAPISAAGLTFNTTGYTIAGSNALTLTGLAPTITVTTAGNTATISAPIAGSAGLVVTGAGMLILTNGSNTYTGSTTISIGTLQLGTPTVAAKINAGSNASVNNGGKLSLVNVSGNTFANNVSNGVGGVGTLAISSLNTNTLSNALTDGASGQLAVTQSGTGTTILTGGSNTYSGATTIASGQLQIGTTALAGSVGADSAVSVGTGGTLSLINVQGGVLANNITNGLGGAGLVKINSTSALTLIGVLSSGAGTIALTQSGTGTTTLTGSNTYTGATSISAGTLQIGNGSSGNLSGTSVAVSGSATLVTDLATGATLSPNINLSASTTALKAIQAGTNTIGGVISGTGVFDQNGTGITILSNTESYTGATNVTAGTLEVVGSLAAGSPVAVATGGTLTGAGTIHGKAALTGNGTINLGSGGDIPGTLTVTGGNWDGLGTVGGLVTSSSGTFTLGAGANLTASAGLNVTGGTLAGTGTLTGNLGYSSSTSETFGGVIGGAGATLTMNNASSTLTLIGANTYTGATTIKAGTLKIGNGSSNSVATSGVTVSGGSLALDLGLGSTFAPNVNLSATTAALKAIQTTSATTITGVISGTGVFDQLGSTGTTILSGAEIYTGATNVTAGELEVNGSLAAASTVNIGALGTLAGGGTIKGNVNLTGGGSIDLGSGGVIGGTLTVTGGFWSGLGTVSGKLTSSSGDFDIGDTLTAPGGVTITGGTLDGTGTLAGNLNYTSASNSAFAGIIAGTGTTVSVNHAGSTLTLEHANSYTGATTITAGTLQVGNGLIGSLSGTSVVTVSGTGVLSVDLADGGTFTDSVVLSGTGASFKALEAAPGSQTISSVISGTGLFNQAGSGTTIIPSGTNDTYTDATSITAGTLEVNGSLASASIVNVGTSGTLTGGGTINGKATLAGNGAIDLGAMGRIVGTLAVTGGNWNGLGTAGGLVTSSSGTFTIATGANLTASAGLNVTGGTLTGTGTVTGNLSYSSSTSGTFGGIMAGTGATLTMNNASSTLTLIGANTYTGATTISAGTLAVGNGTAAGASLGTGPVTVNTSGVLALNLASGGTFSNNVTDNGRLTDSSANNFTVAGLVGGTGSLTKTGNSTVTLTGANTYSGTTTISGGTVLADNTTGSATGSGAIAINNEGTLGGSGSVAGKTTLNSGGTLFPGGGSSGTVGTTLDGSSLVWNGGGTLTFQVGATSADALDLSGALTKGSAGTFTIDLLNVGVTTTPENYTLVTFSSTTFALSNFTLELPQNVTGTLVETSTSLEIENLVDPPGHGDSIPSFSDDLITAPPTSGGPGGVALPDVPEPSAAVLVACGIGTLLVRRRRVRRVFACCR